jgi:CHAT domain-containing protein
MQALLEFLRSEEDAIYGLLLKSDDQGLRQLALRTALLRKGRVAEAGAQANRLLHNNLKSPAVRQVFLAWQRSRQQREALLYGGPGVLPSLEYQRRLQALKLESESLETQLAATFPELRQLNPPPFEVIVPAVASRLPNDGVLVEVVWALPYLQQGGSSEENIGSPHYVAILLFPNQQVVVQDLGAAARIDDSVQKLRQALRVSGSDPVVAARALFDQILAPLQKRLEGRKNLFLSLDGSLNLVPFDALHDGSDYLLGRYHFHYLTSGRDLLRDSSGGPGQPALVLADPDFAKAAPSVGTAENKTFYNKLAALQRLPGARREAERIAPLVASLPLVGSAAKESVVRAAHAPWVLHIASHGFFLDSQEIGRPSGRRAFHSGQRKGVMIGNFGAEPLNLRGDVESLSRSALVLAGAAQGDQAKTAAEDGLLTAEEARSLDLFGTQLVVLSACDTGEGDLSAGQGVYGLRRAFLVAGAETLVTSLWSVSDTATGKLMERYYHKLLKEKKGRLEGMQEAMQGMRAQPQYSHPYYWAPFLVIGSDGPLRPPAGLRSVVP